MKSKPTITIVTAGAVLVAGVIIAQDTNSMPPAALQIPVTDQDFAWEASIANLKEVRLSQMAEEKSTNDQVKVFARHMIHDHLAANKKLTKIAQADSLNLPDTNSFYIVVNDEPEKQATQLIEHQTPDEILKQQQISAQHIEAYNGTDFEQAFADAMVKDHVTAIQLFENASQNVTNENLKRFATKTLSTLHHHYQMAQMLQESLSNTNVPAGATNSAPAMNPGMGY